MSSNYVYMDAADGSWHIGRIRAIAIPGSVKVEQVDEDKYKISWDGPWFEEIED